MAIFLPSSVGSCGVEVVMRVCTGRAVHKKMLDPFGYHFWIGDLTNCVLFVALWLWFDWLLHLPFVVPEAGLGPAGAALCLGSPSCTGTLLHVMRTLRLAAAIGRRAAWC